MKACKYATAAVSLVCGIVRTFGDARRVWKSLPCGGLTGRDEGLTPRTGPRPVREGHATRLQGRAQPRGLVRFGSHELRSPFRVVAARAGHTPAGHAYRIVQDNVTS